MQRLITASLLLLSTALAISLTVKTCRYLDASQAAAEAEKEYWRLAATAVETEKEYWRVAATPAAESSDPFDPFR